MLAHCTLIRATEPVRWSLLNYTELLEFTRGLPDGEGLKWWYGALWLCYDKLDTTVRDEVKRIAADMLRHDDRSDLNLYLSLLQEVARIRQELNELPDEAKEARPGGDAQTRLITMEGNYYRLPRITGRRQSPNQTYLYSTYRPCFAFSFYAIY